MSSIYIPRFVKEIRRDSFIGCRRLKKIVFTENSELNFIGAGSIYKIPVLTHIYIPASVKYIQYNVFGSNVLSNIYYCGNSEITNDVFQKKDFVNVTRKIYVTEQYPISTFGGLQVQEKRFSCFADFYQKICRTLSRRTMLRTELSLILIMIL